MVQSRVQKLRLLIFLLFFITGSSFAQNQDAAKTNSLKPTTASPNKIKPSKAMLNFEDELVEGTAQKPELFYLFQKKNFNYKRLIKLRENFLPEMKKTTEDIQRVRSTN